MNESGKILVPDPAFVEFNEAFSRLNERASVLRESVKVEKQVQLDRQIAQTKEALKRIVVD